MSDSERSAEHAELIQQLHSPQTRRAARQRLVAGGAVEPLLECLDSTNESVTWAAVESLGELRAPDAVGPLVELLGRGVLVLDVCEALTRITGQYLGADVDRWREWIGAHDNSAPAELNVADCIAHTGEYLGVEPARSGKSYEFTLSQDGGRSQKVAVYFGREDSDGGELVVIYSECGPATPKYYEAVLRKNLGIPAGAFAIRDVDGVPNFVIVDTMVAETVTPSALAKKIENIASRADIVEKSLTKQDER